MLIQKKKNPSKEKEEEELISVADCFLKSENGFWAASKEGEPPDAKRKQTASAHC